jgi:hypothetical protein
VATGRCTATSQRGDDGTPFKLDSQKPSIPVKEFAAAETRFAILERTDPERAAELAELAQAEADERWRYYEQLAGIHRVVPHIHHVDGEDTADAGNTADAVPVAAGDNGKGDLS